MNILFITYSLRGGAGRALYKHHCALSRSGNSSKIVVCEDSDLIDDIEIFKFENLLAPKSEIGKRMLRYGRSIEDVYGDSSLLHYGESKFLDHALFKEADLVEFRQLHPGGHRHKFSLQLVRIMCSLKPVIWRLSDMWAFTGYCGYSLDCERWKMGCGDCPQLSDPTFKMAELRKYQSDVSARSFKRKVASYGGLPLNIVGPSRWIIDLAKKSFLGKSSNFYFIPNGIDTSSFTFQEQQDSIDMGRNEDQFVVSASIPSPTNYRKGYDLLISILEMIDCIPNLKVILIGAKNDQLPASISAIFTGYLSSEKQLSRVYSKSDLFILPSRMDNSAQVIGEASACGTPVAAFNVAGNSEYISNENGFLISPYNVDQFSKKVIAYASGKEEPFDRKRVRNYILKRFTLQRQLDAFSKMYRKLIHQSASNSS